MKKRAFNTLVAGAVLLSTAAWAATAETGLMEKSSKMDAAVKIEEMTEEQMEMMKNWEAYSTPSDKHAVLQKLEGTWNTKVQYWMDNGGKAETSEGISNARLIMGGRYLEQNFSGMSMGQPFEGRGILAYDNIQKEFQGIWLDNMSTGIMRSTGQYDESAKTIAEEGTMSCPMTNDTRGYRAVTTFIDENNYTYETFMEDESGEEYRSMVITYSREG